MEMRELGATKGGRGVKTVKSRRSDTGSLPDNNKRKAENPAASNVLDEPANGKLGNDNESKESIFKNVRLRKVPSCVRWRAP